MSPASRILADSAASGTASTSAVPALSHSVAFRAAASTTSRSFSRVAYRRPRSPPILSTRYGATCPAPPSA